MSITVQVKEGTFVYAGTDHSGNARWPFFKKDDKGQMVGRPTPRRFKRILKAEARKEAERASH